MEGKRLKGTRNFGSGVLREVADDFMLETEMLIDEEYGKIDLESFKRRWYGAATAFEKRFRTVLNNMDK